MASQNLGIDVLGVNSLTVENNVNTNKGKIQEKGNDLIPRGTIIMWSNPDNIKSTPKGWVMCDGNNQTPNLLDRFIMGTNIAGTNKKGEADTHTHMFEYTIKDLSTIGAGNHSHQTTTLGWYKNYAKQGVKGDVTVIDAHARGIEATKKSRTSYDGEHAHGIPAINIKTKTIDSSSRHTENRPRWYALCYLMKE